MLRISYQVTAREPLLHGSDNTTTGNKRLFRTERHKVAPVEVLSTFDNDVQRRQAALCILFGVYKSIDQSLKSNYYGYYEPFLANVVSATHNRTKFEFYNQLCESCGVRGIHDQHALTTMAALGRFSDAELMYTMQRETQYLFLMLRDYVKNDGQPSLFDRVPDAPAKVFRKEFDDVPYISGNAIGGILRRLAVKDFFARIGYEKEAMGVDKSIYHWLMTGGNIEESTGKVDLTKKETIARLCPPIGLLGSALGNMTTTSLVKIGSLRPVCSELGYDAPSFWELLGTAFGTRSDSSKAEMDIDIVGYVNSDRNADQMIYYNQVINAGASMFSDILMTSEDPLMVSCFWHMIGLWKEFGYIAGRSARGYGRIEIDIEIPQGASGLYLQHLEEVKEEALKYFTIPRNK